jgi:hypothetical protein
MPAGEYKYGGHFKLFWCLCFDEAITIQIMQISDSEERYLSNPRRRYWKFSIF